ARSRRFATVTRSSSTSRRAAWVSSSRAAGSPRVSPSGARRRPATRPAGSPSTRASWARRPRAPPPGDGCVYSHHCRPKRTFFGRVMAVYTAITGVLGGQEAPDRAARLGDSLLVLDEGEADVSVAAFAESDAGAYGNARVLRET